jgi:hypothetical protein
MKTNFHKRILTILFVSVLTITSTLAGQESNPIVIGVGINAVDNSGSQINELLNVSDNWNFSRLIQLSIEKRFDYDYGLVATISMNKFNVGKTINSELNKNSLGYLSLDVMAKNYTTNYFIDPKHAKYEGFVVGGLGGNLIGSEFAKTINFGAGLNFYIDFYLRINIQSIAKFSIDSATTGNANHFQHSITLIKWIGQKPK